MVNISGRVYDFDDDPIEDASIEVKNDRFESVYQVKTDEEGRYELDVEEGRYMALATFKDYKTENLEFWCWNILAHEDMVIDGKIGGLEVYAMNAFLPQGALPSLIIYFRPMSLQRVKDAGGMEEVQKQSPMDISPDLSEDDIELKLNDQNVNILEINQVREAAGKDRSMIGYLVQCELPEELRDENIMRIRMTLSDRKTGEKGSGCLFWDNPYV